MQKKRKSNKKYFYQVSVKTKTIFNETKIAQDWDQVQVPGTQRQVITENL